MSSIYQTPPPKIGEKEVVSEAQDISNSAQFCLSCPTRPSCKAICPALEKSLPKPFGGINGKKIKFYNPIVLQGISDEKIGQLFTTRGGKQIKPHNTGE